MGRATIPGIYPGKDGRWHVDKIYRGVRLPRCSFESAGEAQDWVLGQLEAIRTAAKAPAVITFDTAAAYYVEKNADKVSLELEIHFLSQVMPFIGHRPLDQVDDEALEPFIKAMQAGKPPATKPLKAKSINLALGMVRLILNLAARSWRKNGKPWLQGLPPLLTMVKSGGATEPMQLSWPGQRKLMPELPAHLDRMALFDLNTGVRENVVCNLRWEWEVKLPDLGFSVFVVPKRYVKGRKRERVLVCNSVAQSIVESVRGMHPTFVFVYSRIRKAGKVPVYKPVGKMNNNAWQKARARVDLQKFRVHDMRHTVGMRLREAGVSEETRDDILWHKRQGMNELYSVAQVLEIRAALELIVDERNVSNVSLASLIETQRYKAVANG